MMTPQIIGPMMFITKEPSDHCVALLDKGELCSANPKLRDIDPEVMEWVERNINGSYYVFERMEKHVVEEPQRKVENVIFHFLAFFEKEDAALFKLFWA